MVADEMLSALLERCTFPPPASHVVCAFSGGPDSTALVALAANAGCIVHAVHIDHGLRDSSSHDAEVAAASAEQLGVEFTSHRAELVDGPNLEARARAARRTILGTDALTGHTADDQAETVLLALLRGSGSAGLSAMNPGPTKPILALRRQETHAVCETLGLSVATDPSNSDPRFRRNRVRHELLPLADAISERDVTPLLTRTALLLRDDDAVLNELAAAIDPTDARAITAAAPALARRALRQWLTVDGYPPDANSIERVRAVAAGDAVACEVSGNLRIERSQQRLQLFSRTPDSL